ncbi:DUF3718 domain-containing protein [Thalassotalea sp. ND16A]|uniref:DUF3718 domain-containing protein n=1 Tax=Thalassotalea sp. ND16A TaxID=1535422 RepID=UPI00051A8B19|nr:DUF3718 domain-containing protein [Thalassotalea sp. ND16A]KGJ99692.1 hypothetical protein ND16A_3792 [Thalassotalea sp. ND16A]
MNNSKLTLTTGALVIASSLFLSSSIQAAGMSSYMENALIDVCKAAKSNNTIRFSYTVKSYRLKTQTVALKVVCNGENISEFAANHGANKTADRLNEALGDVSIEDVALNDSEKLYVNF